MLRKFTAAIFFVVLLCVLLVPPNITEASTVTDTVVPGEVLAVFKAPASSPAITSYSVSNGEYSAYLSSIAAEVGGKIAAVYGELSEAVGGIFALIRSDSVSENTMLDRLRARPDVIGASLNYKKKLFADVNIPDDTNLGKLWGMTAINAPQAWAETTGSENVYAVVIDSGIDYEHGDLAANFEEDGLSASFASGTDEDEYGDDNAHGTHVAGTIGAVGNNAQGVAGVNWKTKLISLRIFDASGSCSTSIIVNALNRLLEILNDNPDMKIAAVNMSYGEWLTTDPPQNRLNTPEYLAMKALDDTNRILMCIAAGNDGTEIGKEYYAYPASYTGLNNVIVVANTADSSTYSRAWTSNYSTEFVDIAAPGTDIWSTAPYEATLVNQGYPTFTENGDKYLCISGTSMATPHVTGAAALLASAVPAATPLQIKYALLAGANKERAMGYTANGFLDVKVALDILTTPEGTPIIITGSLPSVLKGQSYSRQLETLTPDSSLQWSISAGSLPSGITLSTSGLISGTPTSAGTYTFTVKVSSSSASNSKEFSLTVLDDPSIMTDSLPDGYVGNYYSETLQAKGSATMTWSIDSGTLPAGLYLSSSTGEIYGSPYEEGTFSFRVKLSNLKGSAYKDFTIRITDNTTSLDLGMYYRVTADFTDGAVDYDSAALDYIELYLNRIYGKTSAAEQPEDAEQHFSNKKIKADTIIGSFTVGAGTSGYSYRYYDQNNYQNVVVNVGTEAKTFSLAANGSSFYPAMSDGSLIDFVGSADTGLQGRTISWTMNGKPYLNGSTVLQTLQSVQEQVEYFAPYVSLVSKDSEGRYRGIAAGMSKKGSTPENTPAPFEGSTSLNIYTAVPINVSDSGSITYRYKSYYPYGSYTQGGTMYRVISADESLNPKDVTSISAYIYDYSSGRYSSNRYYWYIRNKKSWSNGEAESLYLNVEYNSSITLSDGKPDYDSLGSSYVYMRLYDIYAVPSSSDIRPKAGLALSNADGVLTIGTGSGSYTYSFTSGDRYLTKTISADAWDIALTKSYNGYSLSGSFGSNAAAGLKGRKVSWVINDKPAMNGETDILSEISPDKGLVPYVEMIKSGNNYTGIYWRFKENSAALKHDANITIRVTTVTPYRYDDGYVGNRSISYQVYSETVKAGSFWSGYYSFKNALPQMELYSVSVSIQDSSASARENHGRLLHSWTFRNDNSWSNPKPSGLKPYVYAYSYSVLTDDGKIIPAAPGKSSMSLSLSASYPKAESSDYHEPIQIAADETPSGTLTIKAGSGTYSYYDYSLGEEVTVGNEDKTFDLYASGETSYYLSNISFRAGALTALTGRTLEWTTDRYGSESAVLTVGDMFPHGQLTSKDSEGRYTAFEWYAAKSGDSSPLVHDDDINAYIYVYDSEGTNVTDGYSSTITAGNPVTGIENFLEPVGIDEINYIYINLDSWQRYSSIKFDFYWYFHRAVAEITEAMFPDEAFRQYILDYVDSNHDGWLSQSEIDNRSSLYLSNKGISSLKGIEIFTSLTYLDCSYNKLTELDLTGNTKLITLNCNNNSLTSLNVRGLTQLTNLYARNNSLKEINLSTNESIDVFSIDPGTNIIWEEPDDVQPAFKSANLILSGQIGVNFFLDLPAISGVDYYDGDSCYMGFDINGDSTSNVPQPTDGSLKLGSYFGYRCYVNSVQMADPITADFHYGNDKTVSYVYTVKRYLDNKIKDTKDVPMQKLAAAIKDYGHYAQLYLSRVNKWKLGEKHIAVEAANEYTDSDIEEVRQSASKYAAVRDEYTGTGVKGVNYSLSLASETTIMLTFTMDSGYSGSVFASLNGGSENMAVRQANGTYLVEIAGISAHKLGDTQTVKVTAAKDFTIKVSALTYVYNSLRSTSNEEDRQKLAVALYKYYTSAMDYKNSK